MQMKMKRRQFLGFLGGAAVAGPKAAQAVAKETLTKGSLIGEAMGGGPVPDFHGGSLASSSSGDKGYTGEAKGAESPEGHLLLGIEVVFIVICASLGFYLIRDAFHCVGGVEDVEASFISFTIGIVAIASAVCGIILICPMLT
jgi:hypothetical protein